MVLVVALRARVKRNLDALPRRVWIERIAHRASLGRNVPVARFENVPRFNEQLRERVGKFVVHVSVHQDHKVRPVERRNIFEDATELSSWDYRRFEEIPLLEVFQDVLADRQEPHRARLGQRHPILSDDENLYYLPKLLRKLYDYVWQR